MLAAPRTPVVPGSSRRFGTWVRTRQSFASLTDMSSNACRPVGGRSTPSIRCWLAAPRSMSAMTTRWPSYAAAAARLSATMLFPTPPLPPPTVMMCDRAAFFAATVMTVLSSPHRHVRPRPLGPSDGLLLRTAPLRQPARQPHPRALGGGVRAHPRTPDTTLLLAFRQPMHDPSSVPTLILITKRPSATSLR